MAPSVVAKKRPFSGRSILSRPFGHLEGWIHSRKSMNKFDEKHSPRSQNDEQTMRLPRLRACVDVTWFPCGTEEVSNCGCILFRSRVCDVFTVEESLVMCDY